MFNDTILAISSPPAPGGLRGIVRLSGPHAWELARTLCDARPERGWTETSIAYAPGAKVRGALLLFRAPKTYTGEDIAEIHIPNALPLMQAVIERLLAAAKVLGHDARMAEAGEFSSRAFFNGKMDLTQCEGIAATVSATHRAELRAAAGLRAGALHRETAELAERLANLLALVEAGIDFADEEDIHFIDGPRLAGGLAELGTELQQRLTTAVHIDQLAAPPTVVFVGKPNVGKSSLVNALAGSERSIVSPVAGTTRDILGAALQTARGEIRLLDVPGEEAPDDELRQKMMAAREQALLDGDLVVDVIEPAGMGPDASTGGAGERAIFASPALRVMNKCDLPARGSGHGDAVDMVVSARTGENIAVLREEIIRRVTAREHAGGERPALNHRHRELLLGALRALRRADALVEMAGQSPELLAAEMRAALDYLGQVTGKISPDEVLGRVFAQFCIGK